MTIYEHVDEFYALQNLIDEAIVDEDGNPKEMTDADRAILMEFAEEVRKNFAAKAERICQYRLELNNYSEALKDESHRLSMRAKKAETTVRALNYILQTALEQIGTKKMKAGNFDVTIQNNPPALDIYDEALIPPNLLTVIPARVEPNKAAIKEALKAGETVHGARLTIGQSLRVR